MLYFILIGVADRNRSIFPSIIVLGFSKGANRVLKGRQRIRDGFGVTVTLVSDYRSLHLSGIYRQRWSLTNRQLFCLYATYGKKSKFYMSDVRCPPVACTLHYQTQNHIYGTTSMHIEPHLTNCLYVSFWHHNNIMSYSWCHVLSTFITVIRYFNIIKIMFIIR